MLYRTARKVVIALVGTTLVLIGIALLVLPGPGTPTILAGLAVLAAEFAWARLWLKKLKQRGRELWSQINGSGKG